MTAPSASTCSGNLTHPSTTLYLSQCAYIMHSHARRLEGRSAAPQPSCTRAIPTMLYRREHSRGSLDSAACQLDIFLIQSSSSASRARLLDGIRARLRALKWGPRRHLRLRASRTWDYPGARELQGSDYRCDRSRRRRRLESIHLGSIRGAFGVGARPCARVLRWFPGFLLLLGRGVFARARACWDGGAARAGSSPAQPCVGC